MSSSDVAETGEDRSFDRKDKEATSHQETINSSANARQRALDDEFGGPEARAKLEVGLGFFTPWVAGTMVFHQRFAIIIEKTIMEGRSENVYPRRYLHVRTTPSCLTHSPSRH